MANPANRRHPEWERLTKAQRELRTRKTAREMHEIAYEAYAEEDESRAAELFREAAALAADEGDARFQALNLLWEAESLRIDQHYKEALVALGTADQLEVKDDECQFRVLWSMIGIANSLPLPFRKQQDILHRLAPFKDARRIGDSRSVVLYYESMLLCDRGRWEDALNKALEAFAKHVDDTPSFVAAAYYNRLVSIYRADGMAPQAWETLRRWRERGTSRFPSIVCRQLRHECWLLFEEGHADRAWDVLQRCVSAERELPDYYGTVSDTLRSLVTIGCATGRHLAARGAILDHRGLRNSESMWVRYRFRCECARYWCSLLEDMAMRAPSPLSASHDATGKKSPSFAARSARTWLGRAEALATELDRLLECDVRLQEVKELRERLQKASEVLGLDA